jgi:hypothetical protein
MASMTLNVYYQGGLIGSSDLDFTAEGQVSGVITCEAGTVTPTCTSYGSYDFDGRDKDDPFIQTGFYAGARILLDLNPGYTINKALSHEIIYQNGERTDIEDYTIYEDGNHYGFAGAQKAEMRTVWINQARVDTMVISSIVDIYFNPVRLVCTWDSLNSNYKLVSWPGGLVNNRGNLRQGDVET